MKVYKSGQGYYTRLISGIGVGLLIATGISWIVEKLDALTGEMDPSSVRYLQAGVAVALIVGLGLIVYHFVAVRQRSCDFLIDTEGEMKKVNWPVRREVIGSTWVVIGCVFLLTLLLFASDLLFMGFFSSIDILEIRK